MSEIQWDNNAGPAQLEEFLTEFRLVEARELIQACVDYVNQHAERVPVETARSLLDSLKKRGLYEELARVSRCFIAHQQNETPVVALHVQGLIDTGRIGKAIDQLCHLKTRLDAEVQRLAGTADFAEINRRRELEKELDEVIGLFGRAYKQLYLDAGPTQNEPRDNDYEKATKYYLDAFQRDPERNIWHGINYVALLTHRHRVLSNDPNALTRDADAPAKTILAALDQDRRPLNAWEAVTRMEALIALGRQKDAVDAAREFLDHPDITVFKINSSLRQLKQLWGLVRDRPPGANLLPMMEAKLFQLGGGTRLELGKGSLQLDQAEATWGDTRYQPLKWLQTGLQRAGNVVRIGRNIHRGKGTGFVFDPDWLQGDLKARYADAKLILTNEHVCSKDPRQERAIRPEEGLVAFLEAGNRDAQPVVSKILDLVASSPENELDFALLAIEKVPDNAAPPPISQLELKEKDRVNVIGHPYGGEMTVSLQDNRVVGVTDRYIHYKTPTETGSSGSPVYDQNWDLVGLHHYTRGSLLANEGVRIERILEHLN